MTPDTQNNDVIRQIHGEMQTCLPSQSEFDALVNMGITDTTLADIGGFGVGDVTFMENDFEFGGDTRALIIPAYEGGQLLDLVAVNAKRPTRFARLYCRAWCLGEIFNAWEPNVPLPVWRSPLRWLREGAEGVVIMDWGQAYWRFPDLDLIAEDEAHGQQIRKLMRPDPWRGKVLLRKERAA